MTTVDWHVPGQRVEELHALSVEQRAELRVLASRSVEEAAECLEMLLKRWRSNVLRAYVREVLLGGADHDAWTAQHARWPAFDDRYVLDTSDLAWARWWFGATEREAIAATFHAESAQPLGFALADARAAFTADGPPARGYLDAARHAVAFLAARGARASAEWRHLASQLGATVLGDGFTADGGIVARTGRGAATIEVTTARHAGRLVTVARAGTAAPDEPRHLAIRADRVAAPLPPTRGRADPTIDGPDDHTVRASDPAWAAAHVRALTPALAAARPDLIEVAGDRVAVLWAGPLFDLRRLTAGIDLVARVTRHGALGPAPYR